MGYTHYWHRPAVIAEDDFHSIRVDFERLILPLADAGVDLAGGLGEGVPVIDDDTIRFNGLHECGHPKNEDIFVPYPSELAQGIGPSSTALDESASGLIAVVKHRCCGGVCSCETFSLPRYLEVERRGKPDDDGLYIDFVKTAFRPYDIAVTAALLIAKKRLQHRFLIHSNGADAQWLDARRLCQRVLGYGDWFGIVEEKIVEEWPGEPPSQREVLLRSLVELDPATLA